MGFLIHDDKSCTFSDSGNDLFRGIPKNSTGFYAWKIEGLGAIAVPRGKIGVFLSDAAYIVYAVSPVDGSLPYPGMPTKEVKGEQIRAIHFWIGASCDAAGAGCAALRAAELDAQVLSTVLYREAQGRESPKFLSYFKDQLVIRVNHSVEPSSLLYKVTGVGVPVLVELGEVSWEKFSSRDVILLDISRRGVIFLWIGSSTSPLQKSYGARIARARSENNNLRVVVMEDGYEQTLRKEDRALFDNALDPSTRIVMPGSNEQPPIPSPVKLYKCTEQTGKYKVVEMKSGPILRTDLVSNSVFLIDRGEAGVWAWVGRDVNDREKLEAVRNARGFVKKKGYPASVPVARAIEGHEPAEMRSLLRGWERDPTRPIILPAKFGPDYMAERPRMAADCQLVDDGTGERTTWRVNGNETVMINDGGIYYAKSCYVLKYQYGSGRKSRVIVYCWHGAHSTSVDREVALDYALTLAEESCVQIVKVSQGREPSQLLQIYGGRLMILSGEHQDKPPSKYLVRVLGSTSYTSKALERPLRASSLDSKGVFILFSSTPVVWSGARSTGDSREASRRLAPSTAPLVTEGKEDDEFWAQLGGRSTYTTESPDVSDESERRLYYCRVEGDAFVGQEILGFSQATLEPESVWLMDTGNAVWVWLGNHAMTRTPRECIDMATTFLYTHPAGRDRDTQIAIIRQGFEPPTFTGLFENWSPNLLRDHEPFTVWRASLLDREESMPTSTEDSKVVSHFDNFVKYPMKLLKHQPDNLPSGVDVERKEMHLTFDDFMAVFKMQPSEFEKLPAWRRQRLKQAAGLF